MLILKRIVPAIALLSISMIVSLPIAQGMTIEGLGGGDKAVTSEKVSYSDVPLSTDTDPDRIKQLVRRAWVNEEFRWSSPEEWQCFNNIIMHESS